MSLIICGARDVILSSLHPWRRHLPSILPGWSKLDHTSQQINGLTTIILYLNISTHSDNPSENAAVALAPGYRLVTIIISRSPSDNPRPQISVAALLLDIPPYEARNPYTRPTQNEGAVNPRPPNLATCTNERFVSPWISVSRWSAILSVSASCAQWYRLPSGNNK